ncbi:MAG: ATP-binding cassette domain-containing protein [Gammaproteobacteria bacterium]|nr:ATP-binding cassette domain-containing protein [Gammaproteobacteria bacterium]
MLRCCQDPFLFGEPLRNNISYDEPGRNLEVIWDSAEAAALRDTIEEFPAQMDTIVGERGVTLSGGQKQRATLARGLIRGAPVLILDDCFSSVDTETEEHVCVG